MEAASKRADDDVAAKTRGLPPFVKADKVNADTPKRRYIIDEKWSKVGMALGGTRTDFIKTGTASAYGQQ